MSNMSTAALVANEIAKVVDFSYANDQSISNISVALRSIMTGGNTDYVIGGKVTSSGGMNFSIDPIYGHCKVSGVDVFDTEINQPISVESAHASMDRLDTVQIRGKETLFDYQQRKFKDPSIDAITTENIATKKAITLDIMVKKGADGSITAPLADNGWVKLAEIFIPAGTVSLTDEHIRNITARSSSHENTAWTIEKNRVFNPGFISEIIAKLLQSHKEDGDHIANVIKAEHIKFGIEEGDVNGGVVPIGKSLVIKGENYTSQMSMATIISSIAAVLNSVFPYINNLLGRYSYIDDQPVAASTENVDIVTGGEMMIDGIACTAGQMVFLKDQIDKKQNGFWVVHTGAWNRQPGYTKVNAGCFDSKLILIEAGSVNKGKVFYLENDALEVDTDLMDFIESIFSTIDLPGKVLIRDKKGRTIDDDKMEYVVAKAEHDTELAAAKAKHDTDTVQKNLDSALSASLVRPGRNLLEVFGAETVLEAMTILRGRCNGENIPEFSGINIGDYIELPSLTVAGTIYTQNLRILVSGFNTFKNPLNIYGAKNIKNHILFIFDSIVLRKRMNATNNNAGGYPASELRIFLEGATGEGNGDFANGLKAALGGNFLYTVRRYTSTKGAMAWNNYTVFLPTEKEVAAAYYWDETGIQPGDEKDNYDLQTKWSIFNVRPAQKQYNGQLSVSTNNATWWWLSSPCQDNTTPFCLVSGRGLINWINASTATGGVAPAFCIA